MGMGRGREWCAEWREGGYGDEAEVAVSRTRCVVEWERGCDESDSPIGLGVGAMLQFGAMKSGGLIANRCV